MLVYLNALDNPFVYDDFRLIVENSSIQDPSSLRTVLVRDVTRPVVNLSYAVDTALWGTSPFGYHLTNLLLHAVNVVLVFWVVFLASDDRQRQRGQVIAASTSSAVIAAATAVLFAVHPVMTQAVGYVSGRSEVAYTCSLLLAFLAARRWLLSGGTTWWLASGGLWVISLLTKESAVMLPAVLLCYDWFVLDADWAERRRRLLRMYLPVVAAAALVGAVRLAVLGAVEYPGRATPDWQYALVAADVFWRSLSMLAWPRDQSIFHAVPIVESLLAPRVLASVLGLVVLAAVAWRLRRVHSVIAFGVWWFLLLQVPSNALLILGIGEPMAEHRMYLPAVGIFLVWGCGFGIVWHRLVTGAWSGVLVLAVTAVFVAQLALQAVVRNAIWDDPVMLASEAVRLAPDHWVPRVLLGETLRQAGRCADAIPEYRAAIDLRPTEEFAYTKLAGCLIEAGRTAEAEQTLVELRHQFPASQEASMGLGVLAVIDSRIEESRRYFVEALERDPSHQQARQMLAFVEGTLPQAEHLQLCEQMRVAGQGEFRFEACDRHAGDVVDPTSASQR